MHRPILATTALRQLSPRKTIGTGYNYTSKFPLSFGRDDSLTRQRANSFKRKSEEGRSYAEAAVSNLVQGREQEQNLESTSKLEEMSVEVSKVSSICDKVSSALEPLEIDSKLKEVLLDLNQAVRGLSNMQEQIVKAKIIRASSSTSEQNTQSSTREVVEMVSLGNVAKKPRQVPVPAPANTQRNTLTIPSITPRGVRAMSEHDDPERTKFHEAVKAAENSTLIFNLDLGRVPIMNIDTIKTRATLALTSMAAKLEPGNTTSVPCENTVAAIDDVLGVTQNMEFFGRKTKTYSNKNDLQSGSFCTMPVKYVFEDKDTRIEAETVLRDKCGAHCSTPYPPILRECIRQVVNKIKSVNPTHQVKVTVDTYKFSLRVATRQKSEEGKNKWVNHETDYPLPNEALNVDARKVPEGFKMTFPDPLPPPPKPAPLLRTKARVWR
jgi:hypothetical protein